jgi:hypothetical protein
MSNPEQKKQAAEARWEAAQLQAANAQRELDYAIVVFKKESATLPKETVELTNEKILEQQETIKTFLMKSHEVFVSEMKQYEFKVAK